MTLKTNAPPTSTPSTTPPSPVSLLILGAGWTSTFLLPLLTTNHIPHAATTRSGSDTTIPFTFSPNSSETEPYTRLPPASTILITFPLKGAAAAHHIVDLYNTTHPLPASAHPRRWILLGSTGIWSGGGWHSESSPYDTQAPRAQAEDALLALSSPSARSSLSTTTTTTTAPTSATILNLSGLYDSHARRPRNWLARVAPSKHALRDKGCVHLVHGRDVARCVVLCMANWEQVAGRRWVITDLRCYDWWGLGMEWGVYARGKMEEGEGEGWQYEQWVRELMEEEGVRALPRDSEMLGRKMDGRGFWGAVGDAPEVGRVE